MADKRKSAAIINSGSDSDSDVSDSEFQVSGESLASRPGWCKDFYYPKLSSISPRNKKMLLQSHAANRLLPQEGIREAHPIPSHPPSYTNSAVFITLFKRPLKYHVHCSCSLYINTLSSLPSLFATASISIHPQTFRSRSSSSNSSSSSGSGDEWDGDEKSNNKKKKLVKKKDEVVFILSCHLVTLTSSLISFMR